MIKVTCVKRSWRHTISVHVETCFYFWDTTTSSLTRGCWRFAFDCFVFPSIMLDELLHGLGVSLC
jgi:hypothetical protein